MNLSDVILEIYPNLVPFIDYEIRDDGNGQYIYAWKNSQPRPTEKQLNDAWVRIAVKRKTNEFTLRQLQEIGKSYTDVNTTNPYIWIVEMLLDISQTLRTIDQSSKLKNAADQRTKRNTGLNKIQERFNAGATANEILNMRWEDI